MDNTSIPEVRKTVVILRELSADEKVQQEVFYREKRLHDEATALGHARREGRAEGEEIGLAKGRAEGRVEGLAEGKTEGRAEEKKAIAERLRSMGFSEEQIRQITDPDE